MASTNAQAGSNNLFLTPQQQSLLFAALNSNKQASYPSPVVKHVSESPTSLQTSPNQGAGIKRSTDTPYLDNYDYDFGDSSFDFEFADTSQASMIGDLPNLAKTGGNEGESSDKRAHPDDDDDDDESPGNDAKRRESTEKVAKKPGRKPLTSEPSSKRKAQNRAAQRAFRERKEKHLKDLEDKVDELQKASEAANNENSVLRSQVDKMTSELAEYKNRFAAMNSRSLSQNKTTGLGFGAPALGNLNDVNFQFEFPKFGVLPGPPAATKASPQNSTASVSPHQSSARKPMSPPQSKSSSESPLGVGSDLNALPKDDISSFSSFFNPAITRGSMSTSRASVDSNPYSFNNGTATSSPSSSTQSNAGPSSSCGTSPEPFTQSPMGFKPVETMTTIGEEQTALTTDQNNNSSNSNFGHFASVDNISFDWLAQQNGGQFDPQLFGDYRDTQNTVLPTATFDDSFFNDALDTDFFMPYNMAPSPAVSKKSNNLIDQIDAANNADDEVAKPDQIETNYGCTKVWERLQNCPKVQNGEFDLDDLCSELQKKAKCSGQGPVVSETDFQKVVQKWMGKDAACVDPPAPVNASQH
ncbi:hypothetical protein VD0002_g3820 [Verticillium dahliae]|uniref:Chap1 n=2 Tax=Verticillium dahliae TaxID=27337 RepID=G2WSJ2_VERDV|nr:Chap1 [Verticillium dahliae VdLs.17]KAF3342781.1 hypothetical protein VdG2_08768 [Verticillium dahliae VDG2]KAH6700834.1 transcription factor PAP1-domain-containing protein [Verticillium dahliae]EGY17906.1 Chap1 [Verticillium dahliae VdLs.17]PNH33934.1 hypothetical protein BJF96_g2910 [Verticillium dahliae]PNH51973.1 hypothetical protein VD0003_g5329 [Verticillium dahliae]